MTRTGVVCLVDLTSSGHHQTYMELFCAHSLDRVHSVQVLYSDADGLENSPRRSLSRQARERLEIRALEVVSRQYCMGESGPVVATVESK